MNLNMMGWSNKKQHHAASDNHNRYLVANWILTPNNNHQPLVNPTQQWSCCDAKQNNNKSNTNNNIGPYAILESSSSCSYSSLSLAVDMHGTWFMTKGRNLCTEWLKERTSSAENKNEGKMLRVGFQSTRHFDSSHIRYSHRYANPDFSEPLFVLSFSLWYIAPSRIFLVELWSDEIYCEEFMRKNFSDVLGRSE